MVQEQYCKELRKNLKYHAAWLPNSKFELGDYGTLSDEVFSRIGNIKNLGIPIKSRVNANLSLQFSSQGTTSVQIAPNASIAGTHAGLKINFSKKNGVFFYTKGNTRSVQNYKEFSDKLLDLWKNEKWDLNHHVVTEIANSKSTTSIISSDSGASIELEASSPSIPSIDIANLDLKLNVKSEKSIHTKIITDGITTPLFRLSALMQSFADKIRGNDPKVGFKALEAPSSPKLAFMQLSYNKPTFLDFNVAPPNIVRPKTNVSVVAISGAAYTDGYRGPVDITITDPNGKKDRTNTPLAKTERHWIALFSRAYGITVDSPRGRYTITANIRANPEAIKEGTFVVD